MRRVRGLIVGVRGPDGDAVADGEIRGGAVVGRRRAAGQRELAAAGEQHVDQHGRLRLDVQAHAESAGRSSGRSARVLLAAAPRAAACSRGSTRPASAPSVIQAIKDEGLPRAREPFDPVTSLDFVEALPADYGGALTRVPHAG